MCVSKFKLANQRGGHLTRSEIRCSLIRLRDSSATRWRIKNSKEISRHNNIKTTERYHHAAKEQLVTIRSPLDYLDMGI